MSLALTAYRYATMALAPVVPFALARRARLGKEDSQRIRERLGYAGVTRPAGQLLWIHGASVGECLSVLPLVDQLLLTATDRTVLVTSGTVTAAKLMGERLPHGALHQYAPVDTPSAIRRFLDHWRPDAALFVDSEIWPNIISLAHGRSIPLALVNGRMSERSFRGWKRMQRTASSLLGRYDLCLAQDADSAERLTALGAKHVEISGNLKADAPPLAADAPKLDELRGVIGERPVLLAVSTHAGEEETILPAHDRLRRLFPDLLTIIAPRHPIRGHEIAMLCGERSVARRSKGEVPYKETEVYVADTLGELGIFYRLSPFAFVGGSLVPHGGQNPLEPGRLERAVLAGPHTQNFTAAYEAILAVQGFGRVLSSTDLATVAERLLVNPGEAMRLGKAAAEAAHSLGGAVERTRIAIEALLSDARA
jgi:3-deoxy-D-manno-octulosonic-acid transferase